MSTTVIAATCTCGSLGRSDLRQCPDHFHIWRGDKRMVSVGRIIRETFPQPEKLPPPDVLENARLRGDEVDRLLSAYALGRLQRIPAGTRIDAKDLFLKAQRWLDKQGFKEIEAQVLLADENVGGIVDFRLDGMLVDLKCTYDVSATHVLQVGGYAALDASMTGHGPRAAAILHVTERYPEAKLVTLNMREIIEDFSILRECWSMIQRRK